MGKYVKHGLRLHILNLSETPIEAKTESALDGDGEKEKVKTQEATRTESGTEESLIRRKQQPSSNTTSDVSLRKNTGITSFDKWNSDEQETTSLNDDDHRCYVCINGPSIDYSLSRFMV